MKILVDILGGDAKAKFTNDFMHAGDVFESGKQLAQYESIEIDGNDKINIEELIPNIRNAWESPKGMNGYIVFAAIRSIDGKRCIEPRPYFMQNIQTISMYKNGKLCWSMFKDILYNLGYKAITDEHMRVTSVLHPNIRTLLKTKKLK